MKNGRFVYIFLLLGMFVPFQIVQIPIFFLIRSMGLYNQFAGMWLVHMAYGIPFCTFFMRNFFATVPRSMYEAAAIDGCSPAGYFFKILMPASVSGLAALTIVQSRGIWNDLLFALTLTSNANARPVTMELYGMVGTYDLSEGPLMASAIVSTLPVIIVFLIFQKAFTRGLLGGSSK
jgi:ABC-type glycerol-3-phosphate transport system permease component